MTNLASTTQRKSGYVYLFASAFGYKIGRTRNIPSRTRVFNVKLPFDVRLLHVIETCDSVTLEKTIHDHFAAKRLNGEWFALSKDDVDSFVNWIDLY